jgi:hypothetical protein
MNSREAPTQHERGRRGITRWRAKHVAPTELGPCFDHEAINIALLRELHVCGEIAITKIASAPSRHERRRRDTFIAPTTPKAASSVRSDM